MSDEKVFLLSLGCEEETIRYLGDGVYAGYNVHMIWLVCRRENDFHYIALDQETFINLHRYTSNLYNSKKEP